MIVKNGLLLVATLMACAHLSAQLCQGSLGDPIVNITFGSGPNPGPILKTTTANITYQYPDCPNDGFYTVRNYTSGCFSNTWHTLNADHTGDPNGYFLLINGSFQKSEFYLDTVKGLCPSTTYEFAAWIVNVIIPSACGGSPKKPNLTFSLERTDGTVLQSYTTGDISSTQTPVWNQYGFFFTTPFGVSTVVLRISNNAAGGCGNDFAIDDITFRPCGPQLNPSINGLTNLVRNVCAGDNTDVTLECNVSAGYNNPAYLWQQSNDAGNSWTDLPGETSTVLLKHITPATAIGSYLYRLTVAEASNAGSSACRVASPFLTINVNSNPTTSVNVNTPACAGSTINFNASSGGSAQTLFSWLGPNSFSGSGPSVQLNNAQVSNSGKYYVLAKNTAGCQHLDSVQLVVSPAPVITTSFTTTSICKGDSVQLNSAGGTTYFWSPGIGLSSTNIANPVARPVDSIIYKLIVENALLCRDSTTVAINVLPKPEANAGPDKTIVEGQSVQLEGSISGGNANFIWFPGVYISNAHTLQPTVTPPVSTSYILTAQSMNGCGVATDTTFVKVYKNVVIPNAFSPNGDGINDTWNIVALSGYSNYELSVYNRYGALVFNTKSYDSPWNGTFNGKALPVGTYYYLLDLKLGLPKLKGYVVILK